MGQKKLIRFKAIQSFPNVLQYPEGMPGKWKDLFKNENPITLELACGKGEYTVGLSRLYPAGNFIGVDLKGNRIYSGALECLKNHIPNAAFLRTQIDKINRYFQPGEVSEIWITFPDPQLKNKKSMKRLTSPFFLSMYKQILIPGGKIHLKTDNTELYKFTLGIIKEHGHHLIKETNDLYASGIQDEATQIQTHYEKMHLAEGLKIKYVVFSLNLESPPLRSNPSLRA